MIRTGFHVYVLQMIDDDVRYVTQNLKLLIGQVVDYVPPDGAEMPWCGGGDGAHAFPARGGGRSVTESPARW